MKTFISKILENQIQQSFELKRLPTITRWGLSQEGKGGLAKRIPTNVIYHINRIKGRNHRVISNNTQSI